MKKFSFSDYDSMSQFAANEVISLLRQKSDSLICAATGHSPKGLYNSLINHSKSEPELFEKIRLIKLDEWGGLGPGNPATCEHYLQDHLVRPLSISDDRYISFQSNFENSDHECMRVQNLLSQHGPIDICILGLGQNGHLGFIEPAPFLHPSSHIANLSADSLSHQMIQSLESKPTFGLTLGMQDILSSKHILLLITGKGKGDVYESLIKKEIRTTLPASFLWLHQNIKCLVDEMTVSGESL
jgi:galactosamine-6-phosphate isomerase